MLVAGFAVAQTRTISGNVTDEAGDPAVAATVRVTGSNVGTVTDIDGNFTLDVPSDAETLTISYIGMEPRVVAISDNMTVSLIQSDNVLDDVVVTALGITRDERSLSYSTQSVDNAELNTSKQDNIINSLSGKFSGVDVTRSNNFGGSSNVTIRGNSLLRGGNGALIVIDGVPVNNSTRNSGAQAGGSVGYDYGNAASDLNPDNIKDVTVLKGASATALYGERAGNGVILITTKKGKSQKGLGVSISSMAKTGSIDKSTFAEYQKEYGAGYGPYYASDDGYFESVDVNKDGVPDLVVPTYDDASYGGKFDPNLNVYQWDSFIPESKNFGKAYPYMAAANTPVDYFEQALELNNTIALEGGNDQGTFRIGYTNYNIPNGVLPNAKLDKHNVNIRAGYDFTDRLSADVNFDYFNQYAKGRNSTGYSDNLMSMFRQWWQVNVDVKELENLYNATGRNVTWNSVAPWNGNFQPQYWDNPYWTRYKNFQDDTRNRLFGYAKLNYALTEQLGLTARVSQDVYGDVREERRAVGSVATPFGILRDDESSGYLKQTIDFSERNYELFANLNDVNLSEDLTLTALLGGAIRSTSNNYLTVSTAGGLVVPGLYSVSNSVNPTPIPQQYDATQQTNSVYGQLSFGYKDLAFLEFSDRYDVNSNLPVDNNGYNYFSLGGSLVLSDLLDINQVDFLKLRSSFAQVGAGPAQYRVYDTYGKVDGSPTIFTNPSRKNNANLKPERTDAFEIGLEGQFIDSRIGFDFAFYNNDTFDQLFDVEISRATGYSELSINAGNINNKGVELALFGEPVRNDRFGWLTKVNFTKNTNEVTDLFVDPETGEKTQNVVLNSYQGSLTTNATLGQPLGVMRGFGYKYLNGQRVVNSSGYYVSETNQVIGDPNPDFKLGFYNSFNFGKNVTASFLIDTQKGGDVYSLDMHYGQGTGVLANTVGTNANGEPVREGGVLFQGVTEDGTPNTTYAPANFYGGAFYWGNSSRNPGQMTVYDASYVKLREASLGYQFPSSFFDNNFLQDASLSLVGNNLWIIDKNVPYADPESGLGGSAGYGYLTGSYPTTRTVGLRLNANF